MKIKVKFAKLQTEYFSHGFGKLPTTLDPAGAHLGMEMFLTDSGLYVSYKGVHFMIPMANIAGCTFFSDPTVSEESKLPEPKTKVAPKTG